MIRINYEEEFRDIPYIPLHELELLPSLTKEEADFLADGGYSEEIKAKIASIVSQFLKRKLELKIIQDNTLVLFNKNREIKQRKDRNASSKSAQG